VTDRLLLILLIAGCLVLGSIILVELEPASTGDAAVAEVLAHPDLAPAIRRQQNPRLDELLATTLARPLFSSTRRPPQGAASDAAPSSELKDTRLTGIVTEPGRRIAIFAVNGAKPLTLTEGENVSGWRIENITPREVSLSGPGGTKTLQPKFDTNLAQPPSGSAAGRPRVPLPAAAAARPPSPPAAAAAGQPNPAIPIINNPPPRPARPRPQR
jgi:general secretion pathway protein N